jgi:syntaxin 18
MIKDQQETRAKKKMEKVMKSGLAGLMNAPGTSKKKSNITKFSDLYSSCCFLGSSMGSHSVQSNEKAGVPAIYRPKFDQLLDPESMEEPAIENALTSAQIQQFEKESTEVLKATENTLKSIKQTESSLLEISNLQTELVYHLTQQNEMIDQLWDDSIISTGKIKQGNQQLLSASESNKESRMWLMVFLLGSSFALLFVDYMAS